jgi:hypothetical protein
MKCGTIVGMTGVGLAVSVPFLAVGASVTVGAAILHILYHNKDENFKGANAQHLPYVKDSALRFNPIFLFAKHSKKSNPHAAVLQELGEELDLTSNRLAAVKALSLLHHAVNQKSYCATPTAEQKLGKLENRLNANQNFLRGSGLEGVVIRKLHQFVQQNRDEAIKILNSEKRPANFALGNLAPYFLSDDRTQDFSLNLKEKKFSSSQFEQILDKQLELKGFFARCDRDGKTHTRVTITTSKSALKAVRFQLAENIVRVCQLMEVSQNLTDAKEKFEESLIDVILQTIRSCQKIDANGNKIAMNLNDAAFIIEAAIERGGIINQKFVQPFEFEDWIKKFSAKFQKNCQKNGILRNDEDLGLHNFPFRTKDVPPSVVIKLQEIPLKNISNDNQTSSSSERKTGRK